MDKMIFDKIQLTNFLQIFSKFIIYFEVTAVL